MVFKCVVFENGKLNKRVIREAASESTLRQSFIDSGSTLVSYVQLATDFGVRQKKVKDAILIDFSENMSALLNAGLPLQESLEICQQIASKKGAVQICTTILNSLVKGDSLYGALKKSTFFFPPLYMELIRIGESSGAICTVFQKLSEYYKSKQVLRQKIAQSLTYPCMVFGTSLIVLAFIIVFVFPRLEIIFEVLAVSNQMLADKVNSVYRTTKIALVGIALLVIISILVYILYQKNEQVRYRVDYLLLCIPFISTYSKMTDTNDFSFAMELLTSSGVSLLSSLEQASRVVTNRVYRKALIDVQCMVSEGESIFRAFQKSSVFPQYVVTWIGIGEMTGTVAGVFRQIHGYFNKETTRVLDNIMKNLEPIFIIITGIVMLILVSQFVLPVFSLLEVV